MQRADWTRLANGVAAFVLFIGIGAAMCRSRGSTAPRLTDSEHRLAGIVEPLRDVSLAGDPRASLVMIEYADFTCAHCSRFAQAVLPEIRQRYVASGKLLFGFRPWVLRGESDALGLGAAAAATCAGRQGHFWDMHDRLFWSETQLDRAGILALGAGLGLDRVAMESCLRSPLLDVFRATAARAAGLGFQGTPSFLVGLHDGDTVRVIQTMTGDQSVGDLSVLLDRLLARRPDRQGQQ